MVAAGSAAWEAIAALFLAVLLLPPVPLASCSCVDILPRRLEAPPRRALIADELLLFLLPAAPWLTAPREPVRGGLTDCRVCQWALQGREIGRHDAAGGLTQQ